MGLERVAAILQGKQDNYDIDILRALILASAEATGTDPDGPHRISHRVIADHLRSTSFLMADGVLPSNEGRGYVLRRIMRRAMRHAHMIGARQPLMWRLVPALVRQMGAAYPELSRAEGLIEETLQLEETRFKAMLERGLHLLGDETAKLGTGQALPGEVAFRLYDTYGFPLDLTQDALREQGRAVDLAGFEKAMEEQRARARAAWAGSGEAATERVWFDIRERTGGTEFLGYSTETAEGGILALVANGAPVEQAAAGSEVAVVLNQTPFYGESGGQVGDTGIISGPDGLRIVVSDTQKKLGDLFVHLGIVAAGEARVGTPVVAEVDHARRTAIRAHHSATHLLHEALRRRLGTHVTQKGSLNAPDRLRFDVKSASADYQRGTGRGRGGGQRAGAGELRGYHPADDSGSGGRDGGDGAVRGEVRGGSPRGDDGRAGGEQAGVVDRAVRWDACAADGEYRVFQDRIGRRGKRGGAADRGGDWPGGRGGGGGNGTGAAGGGGSVAGGAAGLAGTGRGDDPGAAPDGAADF